MSIEVFLIIGAALMFLCMWYCGNEYAVPVWKIAITAAYTATAAYAGSKIMFFIESGTWGGRSIFGGVFLVPVAILPLSKILKISYSDLSDICAPACCLMIALLKVKCKIDGCCYGRSFYYSDGTSKQFPSQIVECIAALLLALILIIVLKMGHVRGRIGPIALISYGASRFVLNYFRETTPWIGPLPAGSFWSIVSIVVGIVWMILIRNRQRTT